MAKYLANENVPADAVDAARQAGHDDGLSAPESPIQAIRETAEAGALMNRDLRNCRDP